MGNDIDWNRMRFDNNLALAECQNLIWVDGKPVDLQALIIKELVECLARNSHKKCDCKACQDVRQTFERLGIEVEQK